MYLFLKNKVSFRLKHKEKMKEFDQAGLHHEAQLKDSRRHSTDSINLLRTQARERIDITILSNLNGHIGVTEGMTRRNMS